MKQLHPEQSPQRKRDIRRILREGGSCPATGYTHLCHPTPRDIRQVYLCKRRAWPAPHSRETFTRLLPPAQRTDYRNMCRRCRRSRHLGCIQYLLQKASYRISGSSSQRRNHTGSRRAAAPYSPLDLLENGDGMFETSATVIKDAGDDPDITNGMKVVANIAIPFRQHDPLPEQHSPGRLQHHRLRRRRRRCHHHARSGT